MKNIKKIKYQIVEAIKPLNPEKIILFGSYAYGNPSENSDLDICVVGEKSESQLSRGVKIRNLLNDIKMSIDILVPYLEEYEFYKKEINSVYYDINLKGEVLWTKNF